MKIFIFIFTWLYGIKIIILVIKYMVMDKKEKKKRVLTYSTDFELNGTTKNGGVTGHYLYYVWLALKRRCYDVNDKCFANYGGRGITICDQWKDNVTEFFKWCVENGYSKGLTLDRKDNENGYSPENCRFVTRFIQQRNRRNNNLYLYNGEKRTLVEWAAILDIPYAKLYHKVTIKKMNLDEAINSVMFSGENKLTLSQSVDFGNAIKVMVKKEGRKMIWLADKCKESDLFISYPSLSNKMGGRECFSKNEVEVISSILGINGTNQFNN